MRWRVHACYPVLHAMIERNLPTNTKLDVFVDTLQRRRDRRLHEQRGDSDFHASLVVIVSAHLDVAERNISLESHGNERLLTG